MRSGRDVVSWIDKNTPTEPTALPAEPPPQIADSERRRIVEAEDAVARHFDRLTFGAARDFVRGAAVGVGLRDPAVRAAPGGWHVHASDDGAVLLGGESWPTIDLLHAVAHLAVPPVFPAHGVEFVNSLIALVQRHAPQGAELLVAELDRRRVTRDPAARAANVRRRAVYAVGKEVGALVRVVLDGPPEEHVCQLLEVGKTGLLVRRAGDPYELEMERLRYFTYRLSSRVGPVPGAVSEWRQGAG